MGSAAVQSTLWGPRAADWADVQEATLVELYESALETLHVQGPMAVLDVGCGSGLFCRLAADRRAVVSGIDATATLVGIAKRRVPEADLRQADMEELPFADRTFDLVTGFNVFQYAQSPVNALREARRVAKPGASVVMAIWGTANELQAAPYLDALGSLLPAPLPGSTGSTAPGPFALSANGTLQALAREAGLVPDRCIAVECVWRYPDEQTALRGLLSAGPAVRAIQASGEVSTRAAVKQAIAPFRTLSGGYALRNTFRYVIAKV
jgi:SAM-dependent methyltransferase